MLVQDQISEIGMQSMMIDVDRSWVNTKQKFLQARSSIGLLLEESFLVRNQMMELSEPNSQAVEKSEEPEHSNVFIHDGFERESGGHNSSESPTMLPMNLEPGNQVSYFPVPGLPSLFRELCELQAEYENLEELEISLSTQDEGSISDSSYESVDTKALSNFPDQRGQ